MRGQLLHIPVGQFTGNLIPNNVRYGFSRNGYYGKGTVPIYGIGHKINEISQIRNQKMEKKEVV